LKRPPAKGFREVKQRLFVYYGKEKFKHLIILQKEDVTKERFSIKVCNSFLYEKTVFPLATSSFILSD